MTRRDYELIAKTLNGCKVTGTDIRAVASALANVLYMENPRFDRDRFMKDCGL